LIRLASPKLIEAIRFHPKEELYDTEKDPWEINNLVEKAEMKGTLERLRGELRAQRERMGE
jgi:hypothetical protein